MQLPHLTTTICALSVTIVKQGVGEGPGRLAQPWALTAASLQLTHDLPRASQSFLHPVLCLPPPGSLQSTFISEIAFGKEKWMICHACFLYRSCFVPFQGRCHFPKWHLLLRWHHMAGSAASPSQRISENNLIILQQNQSFFSHCKYDSYLLDNSLPPKESKLKHNRIINVSFQ